MRLIDAHKLYEQYETDMRELVKSTNCENVSLEALSLLCGAKLIADAPTVDAAPVKHGKWIGWCYPGDEHVECSICKVQYYEDDLYIGGNDFPNYCPHCGAKMDLEE